MLRSASVLFFLYSIQTDGMSRLAPLEVAAELAAVAVATAPDALDIIFSLSEVEVRLSVPSVPHQRGPRVGSVPFVFVVLVDPAPRGQPICVPRPPRRKYDLRASFDSSSPRRLHFRLSATWPGGANIFSIFPSH